MSANPIPNPDANQETNQTPATNSGEQTPAVDTGSTTQPATGGAEQTDASQTTTPANTSTVGGTASNVGQASEQPASTTQEATSTNAATSDNAIPLSNEVQPRTSTPNEEGIITDEDADYPREPKQGVANQIDANLTDLFDRLRQRTGKEIRIFKYNGETKRADIRIEGYNARQTEQVLSSEPVITHLGRDDFRDLVRVGTEPSPIKDRYAFGINGERVAYYD